MPVRAARPIDLGRRLRAVYWAGASARPCFFRARRVPGGPEVRLFVRAPRPAAKRRRAWCAEAPLPEGLQGRTLVLVREHGAKPLGPAGWAELRRGRDCVRVPVVEWPAGGGG